MGTVTLLRGRRVEYCMKKNSTAILPSADASISFKGYLGGKEPL
ncbi:hypothetical protein [Paraburkholderia sacchari]|nr:hypothetical protein [Paraburkholderia sacchari]